MTEFDIWMAEHPTISILGIIAIWLIFSACVILFATYTAIDKDDWLNGNHG